MRGQYGNDKAVEGTRGAPPEAASASTSDVPGIASILAVIVGFLVVRHVHTSPHWLGR